MRIYIYMYIYIYTCVWMFRALGFQFRPPFGCAGEQALVDICALVPESSLQEAGSAVKHVCETVSKGPRIQVSIPGRVAYETVSPKPASGLER